MNLALYHPWLKSKGGAEKVLLEIMKRSEHDVTLFTLYHDPEETFDAFQEFDIEVVGDNNEPKGFVDKVWRFGFGTLFTKLPLEDYDSLLVSEAGLGSLITLRNHSLPVHCYCHTPLRAALPGFHSVYRKELKWYLRPLFDIGTLVYDLLEKRAWKKFDSVMANSELTKERIKQKGLYDEEIEVVNPGVDTDEFEEGENNSYFLYPSRFRRYKRQDLAIEAFREADIEGFELVLAGSAQEEDYIQELEEAAGENVEVRTDVPEEEWRELYENAYSVLFLAEQEDWGIAPLEAMAAGKPVIAVKGGGYEEVVEHGETGVLVDPETEIIAAAMEELAEDEKAVDMLGRHGKQVVQAYSWENFIERFDGVVG
ncbi:MAG: glycosyltransferase [Candidatus Nanohaloarchaeota archaeon QJJ-7]|nr:glycosyltransferase [Candidatus Nanohaloarchaeota archaeon QJJ-7]